jgi:hypothetical protein
VIALVFTGLLWAIVAALVLIAWRRRDGTAREGTQRALREFLWLIPRLAIGIIAAGFLAKLLPESLVARHLGPESGPLGLAVATALGAITPGGPVVGFSIGTAALKAGAGLPQVIAYVTAWSLISLNRMIVWETPIMPARFVWLRVAVSAPLPLLAGGTAWLIGR